METIEACPAHPTPPTRDSVTASFRGQPDRMLDVAPHRLAYRRFGRGPDVLFVHGWPLTSATFRALVPLLADRFTCHLVDLPGAGQTMSPDDAAFDFVSQAAAVRAAADRLGLERYALLSHDSGGLIARFAAADDRRVAGVVAGNTEIPGHTPELLVALLTAARVPGGGEALRAAMQSREALRSPQAFGGCFANADCIEGEFHELMVAPTLASPDAWARQVRILTTIDDGLHARMEAAHARIGAPVLFIWGDDDPIFPIDKARAMLPQIAGGARLVAIPGGRTFVHEEKPEAFVAAAAPFLVEVLGARS